MIVVENNTKKINKEVALAVGMFDGLHLGHQHVIQQAINYAAEHDLKTAVVTFANHPQSLTRGQAPSQLTSKQRKLELLENMGIDYCLVLDFTQELMQTQPENFIENYLLSTFDTKFIAIGFDHHFGIKRSGTPQLLSDYCSTKDVEVKIVDEFLLEKQSVKSSVIRKFINDGEIKIANKLLGYEFMLCGKVIEGDKRGRELGFPTANIELQAGIIQPKVGVYGGLLKLDDKNYSCVMNLGYRPSFKNPEEKALSFEVHILDFDQNIYAKEVQVVFQTQIREEKKFANINELKAQIQKDIESFIGA